MEKKKMSVLPIIGGCIFALFAILRIRDVISVLYYGWTWDATWEFLIDLFYLVIAVTLFLRKRNIILPLCFSGLSLRVLDSFCRWIYWIFSVYYDYSVSPVYIIYRVLCYIIFLFAFVLLALICFDELTNLFSKINLRKIWFVPALIVFLIQLHDLFVKSDIGLLGWYEGTAELVIRLLYPIGFGIVALWATYPDGLPNNTDVGEENGAYCGLGRWILLYLLTLGIWECVWIYRATGFLNKAQNVKRYNPTSTVLLCIFVPFYQLYWLYKHGQKIDILYKEKKLGDSNMSTTCLILGIFIPILAFILMQDKINTICTSKTDNLNADHTTNIEALKEFKNLLDSGIITQEEFEQKKKQLLDL